MITFFFVQIFVRNSYLNLFFNQFLIDVLSSIDIFGLEDNLPDELVSSGNNWGEQLGGNKPPAQGPGPGSQHLNGEDPGVPNIALQRQLQQQQLHHMMQQQQQVNNRVNIPILL